MIAFGLTKELRFRATLVALISAVGFGCARDIRPSYTKKDINEQLVMATLWVQTSAEYRALCYQAMNLARISLDRELAMRPGAEKRAIVVDVDETILQANEYQGYLIRREVEYPDHWTQWLTTKGGQPIPGVVDFLNYATGKNVKIFYISSRHEEELEGTMENLKRYNFPFLDRDHFLFRKRGENSDKSERRKTVAEKYRIVLLLGDNLDDFTGEFYNKNPQERFQVADNMKGKFGTQFILLPNPMYGSWEDTLYGFKKGLSPDKKNEIRKTYIGSWAP